MADEHTQSPTTIREVGIELHHLRREVMAYIDSHDQQHVALEAEVKSTTLWRQEREVYEGIARWLVGSNLAVLIGLVIAIVTLVLK